MIFKQQVIKKKNLISRKTKKKTQLVSASVMPIRPMTTPHTNWAKTLTHAAAVTTPCFSFRTRRNLGGKDVPLAAAAAAAAEHAWRWQVRR